MLQDDDAYKVTVMKSINRIEKLFGPIKYKFAKGNTSSQIISRLNKERSGQTQESQSVVSFESEFDCLVMLDRNVDLISPFCVQQVYEGQMDETFGIKTTMVQVETIILNPKWEKKPAESDYTELFLNNDDFLFKEVRGMSLGGLGVVTREKLKEIKEVMSEKDNPTNINELSKYVTKVK